jgi:two-component system, OmpR family, phosphate regulon response regulator PhoB
MRPTFLIGSDDAELRSVAQRLIEHTGFDADLQSTAWGAARAVSIRDLCGAVIDGRMPDSVRACLHVRELASSPMFRIVAIADDRSTAEAAAFMAAGADEVLFRPLQEAQLVGAIQASTRGNLSYGDLAMNVEARRVWRGRRLVELPKIEFEILRSFLLHPCRVFTRREIIVAAWPGRVYVEPRTVNVHIARLRALLRIRGLADPIRSVRGHGYGLELPRPPISEHDT